MKKHISFTHGGQALSGAIGAFGTGQRMMASRTNVASWAEQRAGTWRLAVEPRRTGLALCLPYKLLEPAWLRHSSADDTPKRTSCVQHYLCLAYQEDMVYSRVCLCLQFHFGKSRPDRGRVRCCSQHSNDPQDRCLQTHLILERKTVILPDRRNLGEALCIKHLQR